MSHYPFIQYRRYVFTIPKEDPQKEDPQILAKTAGTGAGRSAGVSNYAAGGGNFNANCRPCGA